MMLTVEIINEANEIDIPSLTQFQVWVNQVIVISHSSLPATCQQLCISIVDKIKSENLNETYRKKKNPTNVLSFSYQQIPGFKQESLGDLAICAALVREEAAHQQKDVFAHWAHLTIHGVLHLLGYDHETELDAEIMESIEIETLKKLGFNDPYRS